MNRNLTIGLVVLAVLLGGYVLLVQRPRDLAGNATPTTRATEYLWTLTADEVNGLRLEDRVNLRSVELVKDAAGGWTLEEPGPQPADAAAVSSAVSGLTSLTINTTLTATTDLEPFGVLSPTYRLVVNLADGRALAAVIGDKAPTGSTYYVLREGESVALTVNAFGLESLIGLLDNPPVVPATATVEEPAGDITETPTAPATP
jgi:hypothetical protein